MAENKTKPTDRNVEEFLQTVKDDRKRRDSETILEMMRQVTGQPPRMWGVSMVGFGSYHYKYKSGREGDWFLTGFSPRKQNLTLYLMCGLETNADLLESLGKYKTGKSCLYIKNLEDIDMGVLRKLVERSVSSLSD